MKPPSSLAVSQTDERNHEYENAHQLMYAHPSAAELDTALSGDVKFDRKKNVHELDRVVEAKDPTLWSSPLLIGSVDLSNISRCL